MSAQIIDGNAISQAVRDEVKREVERLAVRPGLGVILAGDNPASTPRSLKPTIVWSID